MDGMKLKGRATIERRDSKTGKIIDQEIVDNLIVNDGLERTARLLGGLSTNYFDYIAIGEGTTAATINDTSLETEVTRALASITYVADNKVQFEKTFTFGSGETYDITEAGISDSATESGSILLDRFVFTAKSVSVGIDLLVRITITVS